MTCLGCTLTVINFANSSLSTIFDIVFLEPRNDFLIAFSAYENGGLIFKRSENTSSSMGCLNGIRVLSIVWVIYAHSYMILALGPLTNAAELLQVCVNYMLKDY